MRPIPLAALTAFAILSCSASPVALANHHEEQPASAIEQAVASPARSAKNKARDAYRHPSETLAFFEVEPDQTVVEFIPGGGWYTEILGPLLKNEGTLYLLQSASGVESLSAKITADPDAYGKPVVTAWPETKGAIPAGSVDTVLTFRNVHNLVMRDVAEQTFASFFTMLKPGGVLGVVDHRLPDSSDSALEKSSGYLKLSTVKKLAEDAGFVLEAQSEINANAMDTANWANGVWTLPPTLKNGETDREKYLAIGESDRMTLRFRKPAS